MKHHHALPKLPQLAAGDREDDEQSLWLASKKKEVARRRYKANKPQRRPPLT